jgi:hypothetical protein
MSVCRRSVHGPGPVRGQECSGHASEWGRAAGAPRLAERRQRVDRDAVAGKGISYTLYYTIPGTGIYPLTVYRDAAAVADASSGYGGVADGGRSVPHSACICWILVYGPIVVRFVLQLCAQTLRCVVRLGPLTHRPTTAVRAVR